MTRKIKSIILSCVLCTTISNIGHSATTSELQSVLEKYGVPYTSDCGTKNEAHYNGILPECQEWGMYYDKPNRRCDYCEMGYITDSKTDTKCREIKCPDGYAITIIKDGICPEGYGLFEITNGTYPDGTQLHKL